MKNNYFRENCNLPQVQSDIMSLSFKNRLTNFQTVYFELKIKNSFQFLGIV